jgi:hypothetical protein
LRPGNFWAMGQGRSGRPGARARARTWHPERMAIALVTRRRDGKIYPVDGQLPAADRERAIALAHAMKCEHGLSYRQVVARLADAGLRVSVGSVHAWVRDYRCARCRGNVTSITRDGPG